MDLRLLLSLLAFAITVPAAQAAAQPNVWTGDTEAVSATAAVLTGAVNPRGENTTVFFRYGKTQAYGSRTPDIAVGNATTRIAVSAPVTDLAPNTRYHYRLVAVAGTAAGANRNFRTKAVAPPVVPEPSKLELARATVFRSAAVIDILAPITRRASGSIGSSSPPGAVIAGVPRSTRPRDGSATASRSLPPRLRWAPGSSR